VVSEYTHDCCDAEKIEKVTCEYTEVIERKILEKRFAIKTLGKNEALNKKIRYEALQNQLLCLDYPPLPEPIVEECCLDIKETCHNPLQNNCRTCSTPSPVVSQQKPCCDNPDCGPCHEQEEEIEQPEDFCNCEINPCGLPCYLNTIEISRDYIASASGNNNPLKNGTVYLGYYSCGFPNVITESFREAGTIEVCAIGQILVGYYQDNEFVEIPFTRGEDLCENECGDNITFNPIN
jgi:hypothetical protein